jgi:hypothetical protein
MPSLIVRQDPAGTGPPQTYGEPNQTISDVHFLFNQTKATNQFSQEFLSHFHNSGVDWRLGDWSLQDDGLKAKTCFSPLIFSGEEQVDFDSSHSDHTGSARHVTIGLSGQNQNCLLLQRPQQPVECRLNCCIGPAAIPPPPDPPASLRWRDRPVPLSNPQTG